MTNLVPPSGGLKTKGVAHSEVLTAVVTNIRLFWNVTLRIWALPTFRKTPLPLLLFVQNSKTTYTEHTLCPSRLDTGSFLPDYTASSQNTEVAVTVSS